MVKPLTDMLNYCFLKQVRKNKVKKRKQLPINMDDSDYNLDSLIFWCTSLKMLLRATAYLLRAVWRRFLRRGEIDSSDYHINQGEVSHTESDDAWDFLICWEQNQNCVDLH